MGAAGKGKVSGSQGALHSRQMHCMSLQAALPLLAAKEEAAALCGRQAARLLVLAWRLRGLAKNLRLDLSRHIMGTLHL